MEASTQAAAPTVDAEFQALIIPPMDDERAGLEAQLIEEGCRDALVVWRGHGLLLDGHNRLEICTRRGIPYRVQEIDLPDRYAAKLWIIRNQLNRRNLDTYQRANLVLLSEEIVRDRAAQRQATSTGGASPQLFPKSGKAAPVHVDRELAQAAGVSPDTIHRVRFLKKNAPEEVRERVALPRADPRHLSINQAYEQTSTAIRGTAARRITDHPRELSDSVLATLRRYLARNPSATAEHALGALSIAERVVRERGRDL